MLCVSSLYYERRRRRTSCFILKSGNITNCNSNFLFLIIIEKEVLLLFLYEERREKKKAVMQCVIIKLRFPKEIKTTREYKLVVVAKKHEQITSSRYLFFTLKKRPSVQFICLLFSICYLFVKKKKKIFYYSLKGNTKSTKFASKE